jgi:hypothetical protein
MTKSILCLLLLAAVAGTTLMSTSVAPQPSSSLLTDAEMACVTGGRCGQAASSLASFAFLAGYTSIGFPAASATFFAFAVAIGAGIAVWC